MSRYETLSTLAAEFSRKADEHEAKCRKLALAIANGYMQFLGCGADKFLRIPLDRHLNCGDETVAFDPVFPLVQHSDGYWYFAFQLELKNPGAWYFGLTSVIIGVNFIDGQPAIRCGTDIRPSSIDEQGLAPLFNHLYQEATERFAGPLHAPPRPIGFVNA